MFGVTAGSFDYEDLVEPRNIHHNKSLWEFSYIIPDPQFCSAKNAKENIQQTHPIREGTM
jgi:hypothetical protein